MYRRRSFATTGSGIPGSTPGVVPGSSSLRIQDDELDRIYGMYNVGASNLALPPSAERYTSPAEAHAAVGQGAPALPDYGSMRVDTSADEAALAQAQQQTRRERIMAFIQLGVGGLGLLGAAAGGSGGQGLAHAALGAGRAVGQGLAGAQDERAALVDALTSRVEASRLYNRDLAVRAVEERYARARGDYEYERKRVDDETAATTKFERDEQLIARRETEARNTHQFEVDNPSQLDQARTRTEEARARTEGARAGKERALTRRIDRTGADEQETPTGSADRGEIEATRSAEAAASELDSQLDALAQTIEASNPAVRSRLQPQYDNLLQRRQQLDREIRDRVGRMDDATYEAYSSDEEDPRELASAGEPPASEAVADEPPITMEEMLDFQQMRRNGTLTQEDFDAILAQFQAQNP